MQISVSFYRAIAITHSHTHTFNNSVLVIFKIAWKYLDLFENNCYWNFAVQKTETV